MSSGYSNAFVRLIAYFMHPSLMQESDLRHRARILIVTLLILSGMIGAMALIIFMSAMPQGPRLTAVWLCTFFVIGAVLALFTLRCNGNFRLCSLLVVAADFFSINGGLLISGGGVLSPVTQFLAMPPMLAYFFGGIRWGAWATLVSLLEIIFLLWLDNAGVQFPVSADMQWSDNHLIPSIIGLVFLSAMAFIYDYTAEMLKRERDNEHFHVNQLARTDALTGLSNRLSFDAELQARVEACAHSPAQHCFTLCCLDLNGFKPINDQFGHDVGDEVLRVVAERLKQLMRENDRVGRHGGDEFMLILDAVGDADAVHTIASRLLQSIAEPIVTSVGALQVGGSLGFAVCPDHATTTQALMHAADAAMYTAKRAGGGWHLHELAWPSCIK